jgi:hypothetical protein
MTPEGEAFAALLKGFHLSRWATQEKGRDGRRRRALNEDERNRVLAKTGGNCHICGGDVGEGWQADHVRAYSAGGTDDVANYLAAHKLCNNYRWDYSPEEFQMIVKIGVWARTQIERKTLLGRGMCEAFVTSEVRREKRRKPHG